MASIALPPHILVVDDTPTNRKVTKAFLKNLGVMNVALAENGTVAIEQVSSADSEPFDLIFMDIHMPVMSGLDATRAIRRQGYAGPIVALTSDPDKAACLEAGCTDFAMKPVTRDLLCHLLEKHLPVKT